MYKHIRNMSQIQKSEIARFKSLALARAFRDRCVKMNLIVLGDNDEFWVAYPRVSEWLVRNGYEYAPKQ